MLSKALSNTAFAEHGLLKNKVCRSWTMYRILADNFAKQACIDDQI